MPAAHILHGEEVVGTVIRIRYFLPLLTAAVLPAMLCLQAGHADLCAAVLQNRITLCLHTLIPSLYGSMLTAALLRDSGAAARIGRRLRRIGLALGMPPPVFSIFLLSQAAGYPVGAVLLRDAADAHGISRADAARLSYFCCGAGPAFAVGMAGTQLLGSPAAGWCLLLACFLANLVPAAIFLRCIPCTAAADDPIAPVRLDARCITGAAAGTMRSLAAVCGMVLLFGVLSAMGALLHLPQLVSSLCRMAHLPVQTVSAVIAAALDITQIHGIYTCGLHLHTLLPLAAALLSFGGICVHWQCLALGVQQMHPARMLGVRLGCALLAAGFMRMLLPLIPLPETAAVFAHRTALSQSGSILPGVLILLTGLPVLLCRADRQDSTAAP